VNPVIHQNNWRNGDPPRGELHEDMANELVNPPFTLLPHPNLTGNSWWNNLPLTKLVFVQPAEGLVQENRPSRVGFD
jgi:hypothetical protein